MELECFVLLAFLHDSLKNNSYCFLTVGIKIVNSASIPGPENNLYNIVKLG